MGNVIICGAPRSGSTSLFRYLSSHPECLGSRVKELNYFLGGDYLRDAFDSSYLSQERYLSSFNGDVTTKCTVEASPVYMHTWASRLVAERINHVIPNAKLVFLLREPSKRLLSQYHADAVRSNTLRSNIGFEEYVEGCLLGASDIFLEQVSDDVVRLQLDGLQLGNYASVIQDYLSFFQSNQIHVMFLENLEKNPKREMYALGRFIGINGEFYESFDFNVENKSINPKSANLYKLALNINRLLEPILNRYPFVREKLRCVHMAINKKSDLSQENYLSINVAKRLHSFYESDRVLLRKILIDMRYEHLPEWLES